MDQTQHPVGALVDGALRDRQITRVKLCEQIGIGTTTLWRACKGLPIEAVPAAKLCKHFPDLDFQALTLGTATADDAEAESEALESEAPGDAA